MRLNQPQKCWSDGAFSNVVNSVFSHRGHFTLRLAGAARLVMDQELLSVIVSVGETFMKKRTDLTRARRRLHGADLFLGVQSSPLLVAKARPRHKATAPPTSSSSTKAAPC
jgi:hypothetical protein